MKRATNELHNAQVRVERSTGWLLDRFYWPLFLSELRTNLMALEKSREAELGGTKTGIWIDRMAPILPEGVFSAAERDPQSTGPANPTDPAMDPSQAPPPVPVAQPLVHTSPSEPKPFPLPPLRNLSGTVSPAAGVETNRLLVVFHAINLKNPAENTKTADLVTKTLQKMTNWVDESGTTLERGRFTVDPETLVFDFQVVIKMKRPLRFE